MSNNKNIKDPKSARRKESADKGQSKSSAPSANITDKAQSKPAGGSQIPASGAPPASPEPVIPDILPILPIRDSVAFPGTIMPLNIGRDKSKRLVEQALAGDKLIGVLAQRHKETEDPGIDDIYRIGTVCAILKMLNLPDGTLSIIVHGLTRFGVEDIIKSDPFITARIQTHDDPPTKTSEVDALIHSARQAAYRIFELSPSIPEEARIILDNIDSPGGVADFLAANLSTGLVNRQELLETFDVTTRLRKINTALAEQVHLLELSNKIQTQVRQQIDKSQREYFLQEQLKAIQKELGESDGRTAELDRLRDRIQSAKIPDNARQEAERELNRMTRIPQASPEYSVALDYVTWLCDLPWSSGTEDQLSLLRAEHILNADHYGLEKVKKRIIEFLAVRKLKPQGRGPILCFIGPPGVGKTSLGQSIARALGRKFVRISLGGMHDEAQLRGHRRTYIGAMPGRIIQEIRKLGSNNPVFMLDEVDKLGQDFRGDPASALLEILDPQQNHTFTDNYLDVPFDLSKVMFIATANTTDPIPPPLRDRMELLELSGYTIQEKLAIARRYLVPRQRDENGLTARHITFDNGALDLIATRYTRESGVRNLERQIAAICRAVAAKIARRRQRPFKISANQIKHYLGASQFESEVVQRINPPGVATGLAYTPTGGEILFIEATAMSGQAKLILTGQLGEVMRESAQAALSLVRSRAEQLHVDSDKLAKSDIHVHVPAGAIPKDGPSAGVAMLAALVSLFTGRPCRHDTAMTGEITLAGRVLPIGGVKEKVIAAHRAGITHVVMPAGNRKDLVDVPLYVRRKIRFTFVVHAESVIKAVLEPDKQSQENGGKRETEGKRRNFK